MSAAEIAILAGVGAWLVGAVVWLVRRGKRPCGGDCGSCARCNACRNAARRE